MATIGVVDVDEAIGYDGMWKLKPPITFLIIAVIAVSSRLIPVSITLPMIGLS